MRAIRDSVHYGRGYIPSESTRLAAFEYLDTTRAASEEKEFNVSWSD